ncbi:MAG TPA: phosphoadenylyl-sulfate reductase [Aliidongia sp.]|nr:phosphoadenylyl-sulfate reductase [Aliidongia sp.]
MDAAAAMRTGLEERASWLDRRYRTADAPVLLRALITEAFVDRIAVLSSFGAESALLLALIAEIDPAVPVIFLDTGKLFLETLRYVDILTERLGLLDVRHIRPEPASLADRDPAGALWRTDPDACCRLRKVEPLRPALAGIEALISGRKRYHGGLRHFIPRIEAGEGHIKIDPLADWSRDRVVAEFERRGLPHHPLEALGYASIGCESCTAPASAADPRAGRWAGRNKTECGIHLPLVTPA